MIDEKTLTILVVVICILAFSIAKAHDQRRELAERVDVLEAKLRGLAA